MAKKKKRSKKVKRKAKRTGGGRKITKVVVKRDGSMRTYYGDKPAPWSKISDSAVFYHEKDARYGG